MMETFDQKKQWYVSNFRLFEKSLNGEARSTIHALRIAAIERFAELGFPTPRNEEWKYTDISPLTQIPFKPVLRYRTDGLTPKDLERLMFGRARSNRLVCVNGHFSEEFSTISSLPPAVKIGSLSSALRADAVFLERYVACYARYDNDAFTALSTAFLRDGVFLYIPPGIAIEDPIHLLFLSTMCEAEFVSHPRNLIVVDRNSEVSIIEHHECLTHSTYFTNAVTEIVMGENSVVEYDKLQNESDRSFHIATTHVHQDRSSTFTSNAVSLGGGLVRNNIIAVLDGEGAECTLNGLYLASGSQLVDNHTTIDHAKPHCNSHELYKGILDGKSRGVFNGKIIVRKDAQKTDAKQTNKNLVLSNDAAIDTKPQLEIFANDVKCTHGATIGQLDGNAIFYLRSRGIGLHDARSLLIYAFASDIINRIKAEPMREYLNAAMAARQELLAGGG